ncbi:MAG TPA: hypothetical protein VJ932_12170 [Alkalispirochaeta sp.]|nr:hypothetical protein [Alkalispirochaeta sp.]
MNSSARSIYRFGLQPLRIFGLFVSIAILWACAPPTTSPTQSSPAGGAPAPISPDRFIPVSSSAIIQSGDAFATSHWNDPHVLIDGDTFVIYASSPSNPDPGVNDVAIYRFTSADGKVWVLSPTNTVLDNESTTWATTAVETPSVARFGDTYHMFFTGYAGSGTDSTNYRIGHATSTDGITFTPEDSPLISPSGTVTDFDGVVVAEPGAVVVGDELRVYFSAVGFHPDIDDAADGAGSIVQTLGVIRSSDGSTWTEPELVLRPNQTLFPRQVGGTDRYYGYSTPAAAVIDSKVYLFFDVIDENTPDRDSGWRQVAITYAVSTDGISNWVHASETIHDINDFDWAVEEIRAPALVQTQDAIYLWYAGHRFFPDASFALGIGLSTLVR